MATETQPTAWMWERGGEVFGLSIDGESCNLRWFVNAGCMCDFDDSTVDQSPAEFLTRGVPGQVAEPDEEIRREIAETVERLKQ